MSKPASLSVHRNNREQRERKMALYVNENVRQGNPVRAEDCMRLDGTSPQDGETVVCGTCGVELSPYELVTD